MRLEIDGERLLDARTRSRFSRRQLAEETAKLEPEEGGVSSGMIAQYEKGTRTGISADKLRVLARVLDLDAKELLPEREVEAAGEVFAGKAVALATVNG